MTRPNEEADRLWIQASQLRLIADDMEARAATLRPSRTPLDHGRYFRLLAERDCPDFNRLGEPCDHVVDPEEQTGCARCAYCGDSLHPFDVSHSRDEVEASYLWEPLQFCVVGGVRLNAVCAHIEHRKPVARGGTNDLNNLCLACSRCNLAKGVMTEREFRTARALQRLWAPPHGDPLMDLGEFAAALGSVAVALCAAVPASEEAVIQWQGRMGSALSALGLTHRSVDLEPF